MLLQNILLLLIVLLITDDNQIEYHYYSNGKIHFKAELKEGKRNGLFTVYHENGNIGTIGYMKEGKQDSTWISFYENGDTASIIIYKNGKTINTNGWDINGNHCIIDGNGMLIHYYPGGVIKAIGEMKDNKSHGKWTTYYPNGQLETERYFENGFPVGDIKKWDEKGNPIELKYKTKKYFEEIK